MPDFIHGGVWDRERWADKGRKCHESPELEQHQLAFDSGITRLDMSRSEETEADKTIRPMRAFC